MKIHNVTISISIMLIIFLTATFMPENVQCKESLSTQHYNFGHKGKDVAPVSISYTVPEACSVMEHHVISIRFIPSMASTGLIMRIVPSEGLELINSQQEFIYNTQEANAELFEEVTVMALTEGTLYVNIFISGSFKGVHMVRAAAIPIKVGEGDGREMLKCPGEIKLDDKTGEKKIFIPIRIKPQETDN